MMHVIIREGVRKIHKLEVPCITDRQDKFIIILYHVWQPSGNSLLSHGNKMFVTRFYMNLFAKPGVTRRTPGLLFDCQSSICLKGIPYCRYKIFNAPLNYRLMSMSACSTTGIPYNSAISNKSSRSVLTAIVISSDLVVVLSLRYSGFDSSIHVSRSCRATMFAISRLIYVKSFGVFKAFKNSTGLFFMLIRVLHVRCWRGFEEL